MNNTDVHKGENILGFMDIKALLKMFAFPAIISMLANSLYNIIDQIFIGHAIGFLGIAATTIAFPIVTIVLAAGTLLGVGGSASAAIKLGEGKFEDAQRILNTVVSIAIASGIVLAIVGNIFLEPLLVLFGATDATMLYSKQFGGVMISIIPLTMAVIVLSNMARTDGAPILSMHALVGGVIINAVLAPIFIFMFKWGILGAALATACAQVFTVGVLVWYFKSKSKMRFSKEYLLSPDTSLLRRAMAIGASSCLVQLSATILQIIMNNSLLYYGNLSPVGGDAAIGAMGVVMKVNMIFISICIGIGIGAQPIIGFNKGAEKFKRVLETYKLSAKLATSVTIVGWICCMLFPEIILTIFGANGDEFMKFSVDCMRWFLGGVFTAGFQITSTSYFQASGQPLKASILSLMRQFILLIPMMLIIPLWTGLYGILYAGLLADFISFAVILAFMIKEMKKLKALAAV